MITFAANDVIFAAFLVMHSLATVAMFVGLLFAIAGRSWPPSVGGGK